jgi:hypothetical protein
MRTNKIALALTGVILMVLMVPPVFANGNGNGEPGYTPGFWKHNIGVSLGYNPGRYSAFSDGTKLTEVMLEGYADAIPVTLEEAYEALSAKGPGMDTVRADMANAFNTEAGYGPFVD